MKILVIDDNESYMKLMKFFIAEFYPESTLYSAATGKEGIDIIKKMRSEKKHLDIILCDIQMPQLSGYEVASELKKAKISIPFILITAHDTTNVEGHALALGLHFISKSIGIPAILDKIPEYIKASA